MRSCSPQTSRHVDSMVADVMTDCWTRLGGVSARPLHWVVVAMFALAVHGAALSPWLQWLVAENDAPIVQSITMRIGSGGEIFVRQPEKAEAPSSSTLSALPFEEDAMPMEEAPAVAEEAPAAKETANSMDAAPEESYHQAPKEIATQPANVTAAVSSIAPRVFAPPIAKPAAPAKTQNLSRENPAAKTVKIAGGTGVGGAASTQALAARSPQSNLNEQQRAVALVVERYEQLLSSWVQQHQRVPEYALEKNMRGSALVRIRINRSGQILSSFIEKRTGEPILDRAVLDMIRRANPVPAVPADYPAGNQFDFRIPVHFNGGGKR